MVRAVKSGDLAVSKPLIWVLLVFGIGQTLESVLWQPRFVGERIGLHPVAVIFAVMAGGVLFGFFGVLLALPVSAILVVLVRHALKTYRASPFYQDAEKAKVLLAPLADAARKKSDR